MRPYYKFLAVFTVNLAVLLVGVIALELVYGKWLRTKSFVPNILPKNGISHDLSLLKGNATVTTRIPDDNGAVRYSLTRTSRNIREQSNCNILILGGSTAEERILNKNETWAYRLFSDLNTQPKIQRVCPHGINVTNAAVNGHSIVANYFDVIHWISRFNQSYSTAVIYQGINDFQGDILQRPDFYDLYWQHLVYGLKYNSIFFRLLTTLRSGDLKWGGIENRGNIRRTVKVMPYQEDRSEWNRYSISPSTYKHLSVGLNHHEGYIRLLTVALKGLGVSHAVWITQTKPFCRLQEMPRAIMVRGSKTTQNQLDNLLSLRNHELKSWIAHDRLGDCIRLGIIRGSYLTSSSKLEGFGMKSSVVDYGSLSETNAGSYDDYHKTAAGSQSLWKELVRLGLLNTIVDHIRQLSIQ